MVEKKEYSSFEICRELGIDFGRLRQWTRHGFIKPKIPANGKGSRSVFSDRDFSRLKDFKFLIEMGVNRKKAAKALSENSVSIDHLNRSFFMYETR